MKLSPLAALLASIALPLAAQEPPAPAPAPTTPKEKPVEKKGTALPPDLPGQPEPAPEPGNAQRNPPPSLLPESIPPNRLPSTVPGDRVKNRSTLKPPTTSADLDARIRYRQAYSRAVNEPTVQALWEESRKAQTDYEKRDALKRYYKQLFQRVRTLDKGIETLIAERERYSLRRLDQTRIDPTDPLNDPERLPRE